MMYKLLSLSSERRGRLKENIISDISYEMKLEVSKYLSKTDLLSYVLTTQPFSLAFRYFKVNTDSLRTFRDVSTACQLPFFRLLNREKKASILSLYSNYFKRMSLRETLKFFSCIEQFYKDEGGHSFEVWPLEHVFQRSIQMLRDSFERGQGHRVHVLGSHLSNPIFDPYFVKNSEYSRLYYGLLIRDDTFDVGHQFLKRSGSSYITQTRPFLKRGLLRGDDLKKADVLHTVIGTVPRDDVVLWGVLPDLIAQGLRQQSLLTRHVMTVLSTFSPRSFSQVFPSDLTPFQNLSVVSSLSPTVCDLSTKLRVLEHMIHNSLNGQVDINQTDDVVSFLSAQVFNDVAEGVVRHDKRIDYVMEHANIRTLYNQWIDRLRLSVGVYPCDINRDKAETAISILISFYDTSTSVLSREDVALGRNQQSDHAYVDQKTPPVERFDKIFFPMLSLDLISENPSVRASAFLQLSDLYRNSSHSGLAMRIPGFLEKITLGMTSSDPIVLSSSFKIAECFLIENPNNITAIKPYLFDLENEEGSLLVSLCELAGKLEGEEQSNLESLLLILFSFSEILVEGLHHGISEKLEDSFLERPSDALYILLFKIGLETMYYDQIEILQLLEGYTPHNLGLNYGERFIRALVENQNSDDEELKGISLKIINNILSPTNSQEIVLYRG